MAAERLKRLKDLVGQLERLPASPDRDRVLSEVRSRAVDVDTGITPRAMLPAREPTGPLVLPKLPRRAKPRTIPGATPWPITVPAPSNDLEQLISGDGHLSLEEPSLPAGQGERPVPPWTLGLRG